ncbi:hypothetical protein PGTUg99_025441 [Puccinia graminis f. sp. tritici]|uniref:Uncharacterized protein n=1 Tax=Puccinia graminis f. sp. tritici TaxID=56615 RepID=A0A5B0MZB2_PUCGR|nr:hypothetical protein PGTUg99_025441 [Puccinia graminis f. sp. tritici]
MGPFLSFLPLPSLVTVRKLEHSLSAINQQISCKFNPPPQQFCRPFGLLANLPSSVLKCVADNLLQSYF